MDKLKELLAENAHKRWSNWMKYLFFNTYPLKGQFDKETGDLVIPKYYVDRWKRQLETEYEDLSEKEKNSDRKEADKIMCILKEYFDVEHRHNKEGNSNSK